MQINILMRGGGSRVGGYAPVPGADAISYEWTDTMNTASSGRLKIAAPLPDALESDRRLYRASDQLRVDVGGAHAREWRIVGISQESLGGDFTLRLAPISYNEWSLRNGIEERLQQLIANPLIGISPHKDAADLLGESTTIDDYGVDGVALHLGEVIYEDIERQSSPTLDAAVSVINAWALDVDASGTRGNAWDINLVSRSAFTTLRELPYISSGSSREHTAHSRNRFGARRLTGAHGAGDGEEDIIKTYGRDVVDATIDIGKYPSVGRLDAKALLTRTVLAWQAYDASVTLHWSDIPDGLALHDSVKLPDGALTIAPPLAPWRVRSITYRPTALSATLGLIGYGGGATRRIDGVPEPYFC